jgi:hypothetical protein
VNTDGVTPAVNKKKRREIFCKKKKGGEGGNLSVVRLFIGVCAASATASSSPSLWYQNH